MVVRRDKLDPGRIHEALKKQLNGGGDGRVPNVSTSLFLHPQRMEKKTRLIEKEHWEVRPVNGVGFGGAAYAMYILEAFN